MRVVRWLPIAVVLLLPACGGDSVGSRGSSPGPTDYVVEQTTSTTTAPTTPAGGSSGGTVSGTVPTEQSYTVVAGDYIVKIAKLFNIQPNDLATYNGWSDGLKHPLQPGEVVKIPPGASVPGGTGDTTPPPTSTGKTTTTIAGGACAKGSYTIESGDYPGLVAQKFNVTVDALNAANANTKGYSSFFVGLKIVIPARTGC